MDAKTTAQNNGAQLKISNATHPHAEIDLSTQNMTIGLQEMPRPDEERNSAFTDAAFMDQTQVVPDVEREDITTANIFETDTFVLASKSATQAQASSQEESVATVPSSEPPSLPHPTESTTSVVMEEPLVCSSFSSVPKLQQDTVSEGNQESGGKPEFTQQSFMPTSFEGQEGDGQHATSGYGHSSGGYSEATEEYGKTTAVDEQTAGANEREGDGYAVHEQSGDEQNQASAAYWETPLQSYSQSSTLVNTTDGQPHGTTSFQGGQSAEQNSGVSGPQMYYSSPYDASASYSAYDRSTTQPAYYYQYGVSTTALQEQQNLQSVGYTPQTSYGIEGNDYNQYQYGATSSSYDAQPNDTSQYTSGYYGMEYNAPNYPPVGQYGDENPYLSGQGRESHQNPSGAQDTTGQQAAGTTYSAEVSDSAEGGYGRAPIVPQFMAPLLPELNRPAPIDPFSWEAQESAGVPIYGMQPSVQSQPPQISSHFDESQSHTSQSNLTQQQTTGVNAEAAQPEAKKPPPRPAPPPPGAHGGPPHRPPPPSPHTAPKKPPPPHIAEHPPPPPKKPPEPEPEEDAWSQFKKLTEKASEAVRTTEEKLKELSETTAAKEIKDESYLSQVGGSQAYVPELAQKQIRAQQEMAAQKKAQKKKAKAQGKRAPSPEFTPGQEDNLDRAAQELAMKMAATRMDLGDWKPPTERETTTSATDVEKENLRAEKEASASRHPVEEQCSESVDVPIASEQSTERFNKPITDIAQEPQHSGWAGFDDQSAPELPPSESGFFAVATARPTNDAFGLEVPLDPFASKKTVDPFAPADDNLFSESYDPFDVRSAEDLVEAAKARAAAEAAAIEAQNDIDFFGGGIPEEGHSTLSSPTPEGGSPVSSRPTGFEDDFRVDEDAMSTPTPLFDEDDSEPLTDFPAKFTGDGWELMVRHPIKKKIMGDRYWKPCFVKLIGSTLQLCNSRTDQKPFQEVLLQATYSLSDTTLQAYDVYGKIHTVKLQYVLYKERVGIRPGQISRLVEGHITKYGLPLEHSAQCTVLLKFGSLNAAELSSFVSTVEDVLFRCITKRDTSPIYKQDEVQVHCYDEYYAYVDKNNLLSDQKARVRLFCLAFVSGSPVLEIGLNDRRRQGKNNLLSDQKARVRLFCLAFVSGSPVLEIGLNDRRRQGKEVVRRKDILPMYTERWIRFENVEFHNVVEKEAFDKEQVIRFSPPDGCFFEVMRFRVRPPKNREKPLTVKCIMKIAGSKIEIRLEAMVAAQADKTKSGKSAKRQIPCEDIQIRFPIPEAWIYLFREERHWGVGSVHAKVRRPGKVKNLKDRLMGTVQNIENSLIEAAIGEAKYEHVYRALVWRIPRLPEKHHAAYKQHLLRCRFELSSFDLMPETFLPTCDVEFTMPLATISNTVVRSVSVEQHEDSDRVEKFVRYVAKCSYKVEVDYVQCTDLDIDAILDPTVVNPEASQEVLPEMHKPAINPDDVNELHGGYRIDFSDAEIGAGKFDGAADSSSDEEEDKNKMPIIQIDMKGYGY
uniref:MHD domain-containing protein n=1 Tax=Ascaris lumbricoides TaxID=6252 RepID=A0A9J2P5U7_ASCLU